MKWLTDAQGNIVTRNGMPVLVRDDGSEMEFDGPGALNKITALNKENQTFRTEKKTLEEKLAAFGDADPESIEAFLEELEALGGPEGLEELKKKGTVDVEGLKRQVNSVWEQKVQKLQEGHLNTLKEKDGHIYRLEVSSKFAASPFISEKLLIPPDMAEKTFGDSFKIEEGRMVAYANGEKVWSKKTPGELADFDEAIEIVVDGYQYKDRILKGSNANGAGTQQRHQQQQQQQQQPLSSTQKIAAGLRELGA